VVGLNLWRMSFLIIAINKIKRMKDNKIRPARRFPEKIVGKFET